MGAVIKHLTKNENLAYHVTDAELLSYGLDTPDLTVTVEYTSEDEDGKENQGTFVLHISRDPEEKQAAEEAAAKGEEKSANETVTAYARVGESQIIYRISSSSYKNLRKH